MPKRTTPLIDGQVYHVYNRGIDRQPTFLQPSNYVKFIQILDYYRWPNHRLSYSVFLRLKPDSRMNYLHTIQEVEVPYIALLAFCLMPNHFHILARQESAPGLQFYLAQIQNSYTKNFNTEHSRDGSLFLTQFKATRINSEHQLIHTSRYIHLNPLTSGLVENFDQLLQYPWSSLPQYNNLPTPFNLCNTQAILSEYHSHDAYINSIKTRAPYQKNLHFIHHTSK